MLDLRKSVGLSLFELGKECWINLVGLRKKYYWIKLVGLRRRVLD